MRQTFKNTGPGSIVDSEADLQEDRPGSTVDSEADLQKRLVEWKEIFGRHGLAVSLEKTGDSQQNKDLDIKLGYGQGLTRKKLTQLDSLERFAATATRRLKFARECNEW